ncbi:Transposon Ty3-I Gag-Pol polyprotein [Senna tora]|uniref:Transposon Ty3-I Gag-Pol polyprotein n=1 Tax=Senna tora TaxID=362788 RepID=A0A834SNN9_9FABA|nr:Transposon Ty3-I Gag-Pol polyprotein [Senna tora]
MANTNDESNGDRNPKNSDITLNVLRRQIERMNVVFGDIRDRLDRQDERIASSQISQPKSRRHNRRMEASMKKIESEKCEDSGNKDEFEYEVDKNVVEGECLVADIVRKSCLMLFLCMLGIYFWEDLGSLIGKLRRIGLPIDVRL